MSESQQTINPVLAEKMSIMLSSDFIMTDVNYLKTKSFPITGVEETKEILKLLERKLAFKSTGIGLSAIQIKIPFRVGLILINKDRRVELINPVILETDDEFIHERESCLSLPGIYRVKRFKEVVISNNVIDGDSFRVEKQVYYYDDTVPVPDLIPIAVQHEIDHMDGIILSDKHIKQEPIRKGPKVGRNDPCICGSGKKYKKCCLLNKNE